MGNLLRFTRPFGAPWTMLGDFNCTPADMGSSTWPTATGARIAAPTDADVTCTSGSGRVIDYMMYSDSAGPFIRGLEVVRQVPWGPRLGLRLSFRREEFHRRRVILEASGGGGLEITLDMAYTSGAGPTMTWSSSVKLQISGASESLLDFVLMVCRMPALTNACESRASFAKKAKVSNSVFLTTAHAL